VGVTLAWLMVILSSPFVGSVIYLLFGELRLGNRRAKWAAEIHGPYQEWLDDLSDRSNVDWSEMGPQCRPLARLSQASVGIPAMPDNDLELIADTEDVFRSIIADIDAAKKTCHMVFYIWNVGGTADEVAEALLRAAERGVVCRVLVDAVGSHEFLRSPLAEKIKQGGIRLHVALPAGFMRALFVRFDLRMHRKIVVIDSQVAYTGSLNMVDPRFFKKEAGVGQWVDAMVRVRGPVVEPLAITFIEDWLLESGVSVEEVRKTTDMPTLEACGPSAVQVVPSGPAIHGQAIQRILLMAIYAARRELVLTSPYFVPDEILLTALISAANRGVDVTLIVPAKVDSTLVRLASQAHKGELLAAGVKVMLFDGGLLHTKSITVDDQLSLFGSLNLDPRSLHLNFEITLAVYDKDFTSRLRALQQSYLDDAEPMDLSKWESRSSGARLVENVVRLLSPLL